MFVFCEYTFYNKAINVGKQYNFTYASVNKYIRKMNHIIIIIRKIIQLSQTTFADVF